MNDVRGKQAIFQWIFADHPDGVVVVDSDQRVISTNRRFADMCGTAAVVPDGAENGSGGGDAVEAFVRRLPSMPGATTCREDMVLHDGRVVERDCAALRAADGSWLGCVWFLRDVTVRREIEANLWAQLEELRRWQEVMVDREWRMAELKREVNALCEQQGEAIRYPSQIEPVAADRSALTSTAEQRCYGDSPAGPGGHGRT